jgi:hypothetical protein
VQTFAVTVVEELPRTLMMYSTRARSSMQTRLQISLH